MLQTKDGVAYEPYCSMLLCMEEYSLFPSGAKAAHTVNGRVVLQKFFQRRYNLTERRLSIAQKLRRLRKAADLNSLE